MDFTTEKRAANLVKWLVDTKGYKPQVAYYIAKNKYKLENIDGVRHFYQEIKKIHLNQIKLI